MNINNWLVDEITVAAFMGRDVYGTPSYGSQVKIKCRVERRQDRVKNQQGQEVATDTWIGTDQPIGVQDQIWLPGADVLDNNNARIPEAVAWAKNMAQDITLYEVYL